MIGSRSGGWSAVVTVALLCPGTLTAQFTEPPAPAAYALEGVTLVRADGTRTDSVTLVIRDGRIEAIGREVAVPADARVLVADTLFVYPGFVDAQGEAEYAFPEVEVNRSEIASWNPPRSVQGFQPHRRLVDHLEATGEDLAEQRKQGIVAAAVHPEGRVMPGRGAVLVFRNKARIPEQLVAEPLLGPVMSFQGARGVYPATLFAVIAFYRQTFENARHYAAHKQAFRRESARVPPVSWDPDLEVVLDVMNGEAPVFFAADLARDIQRALRLAREYGFQTLIVGGEEAWKVADELKAQNTPVLVSLDFPEPERWKPEATEEEEAEETPPAVEPGADGAGDPADLDAAALREKERIENAYANAGRLAQAAVTFALTSGGGEADMLEGARKAIEYGLPEEVALRALTQTPARLLGVEHAVQIAVDRPANFLVSDGPLFAEDTRILYTFVEGVLEEGKKERRGGEAPAVVVTGTWDVSIDAEGETIATRMTLEQEGADFTGTMQTPFGEGRIVDGVVSGTSISFTIVLEMDQETLEVAVTGTVEEDEASGSGESSMGSFTWTARRTSGPEKEAER